MASPVASQVDEAASGIVPGTPFIDEAATLRLDLCPAGAEGCDGGLTRTIDIHRVNPGPNGARDLYWHKPAFLPLLAGDEQSEAARDDGWPEVVWDVRPHAADPDQMFLRFRILTFNERIRSLSVDAIIGDEDEVAYILAGQPEASFSREDLSVEPWQAERASIQMWRVPEEELLAADAQEVARDDQDVWTFDVGISVAEAESLREALLAAQVQFRFSFDYVGAEAARTAWRRITNESEVAQSVQDYLASQNLAVGAPITQSERAAILETVSQRITLAVGANDAELAEQISSLGMDDQLNVLFRESGTKLALDDLMEQRSLEAVEDFLKPIYDELLTISNRYDETTDRNEDRRVVDVSASGKYKGLEGEIRVTDTDVHEVSRKYGVSFEERATDRVLEPARIEVSYLAENTESSILEGLTSIQIASRRVSTFTEDEIIQAGMEVPRDWVGDPAVSTGVNVPLGAALCSLSADVDPPVGYAWIGNDAGGRWPDQAWMGDLAGQAMPNADDLLMASTEDIAAVGQIKVGRITEPPIDLTLGRTASESGQVALTSTPLSSMPGGIMGAEFYSKFEQVLTRFNGTIDQACAQTGPVARAVCSFAADSSFMERARVELSSRDPSPVATMSVLMPLIVHESIQDVSVHLRLPERVTLLDTSEDFPRHMPCRWMIRIE